MSVEAFVARHEQLTVLRFAGIVDAIFDTFPDLAADVGLSEQWATACTLQPGWLQEAVRMPALHGWVATTERLIRAGALRRYPEAHPHRHLADLDRVVVAAARAAPDGACGRVALRGRRSFPLCFGRMLMRSRTGPTLARVRWRMRGTTLRFEHEDSREDIAEVDPATLEYTIADHDWELQRLATAGSLLIDLESAEYCEQPASAHDQAPPGSWLDGLSPDAMQVIRATLRVIGPRAASAPWMAGLVCSRGSGGECDGRHLLLAAQRDRVWRIVDLARVEHGFTPEATNTTGTDLLRTFVELAAAVCVEQFHGQRSTPSATPSWRRLVSLVDDMVGGPELLDAIGVDLGVPANEPPRRSAVVTDLRAAMLDAPEVELPAPARVLSKTSSSARAQVDWSSIDALTTSSDLHLAEVRDSLPSTVQSAEMRSWLAAMLAYRLGEFRRCVDTVQACIRCDPDVEQYWLLAAFALRHLGRRRQFEQIVFAGRREVELVDAAAGIVEPSDAFELLGALDELDDRGSVARTWPWVGVLRDLVEARNSEQQLAQYAAVLAGIRRALDDWIPAPRLGTFLAVARRLGLHVELDCVFRSFGHAERVPGASIVPTTQAHGARLDALALTQPDAEIHVFVSSQSNWASDALAAGWYSVEVDGRLVRKPQIDHGRLGAAFGYPDCCVAFFLSYNDWPRLNSLVESARRSERICWETNCLAKHTPFMATFHLPCSFDCEATREQTAATIDAVRRFDPGYAARIEWTMRQRYLAFTEATSYMLAGAQDHAGITHYDAALFVGGKPKMDAFGARLADANGLALVDGAVHLWRDRALVDALEARCDRGHMEVPLLLEFS